MKMKHRFLKYPGLASPFTVDILVELNLKFKKLVTDKLDARSREALCRQEDPATMPDCDSNRIRKSILHTVYGNIRNL